jgi:hypothetical protein
VRDLPHGLVAPVAEGRDMAEQLALPGSLRSPKQGDTTASARSSSGQIHEDERSDELPDLHVSPLTWSRDEESE